MARLDILRTLEQEERELLQELLEVPAFKRLEAIRQVMSLYKEPSKPKIAPIEQARDTGKTTSSIVAEQAERFLRETKRRYTSTPLANALISRGVSIPGKSAAARLASILASRPKVFNNVKGKGYGLVEWGDAKASDDAQNTEAPDPARSGASKPNGGIPFND